MSAARAGMITLLASLGNTLNSKPVGMVGGGWLRFCQSALGQLWTTATNVAYHYQQGKNGNPPPLNVCEVLRVTYVIEKYYTNNMSFPSDNFQRASKTCVVSNS